jgi:thiol-disulfide isomerase/thioredoxin
MKRIITFFCFFVIVSIAIHAQERCLQIQLDSARYRSFRIVFETYPDKRIHTITSSCCEENRYTLIIPDSIYDSYWSFRLFGEEQVNNDSVQDHAIGIGVDSQTSAGVLGVRFGDRKQRNLQMNMKFKEKWKIYDLYEIENPNIDQYLSAKISYARFAKSKEDFVSYIMEEAEKHPDAVALTAFIVEYINLDIEAESLRKIWDLLSEGNKSSYFGRYFQNYLAMQEKTLKFVNQMLPEYRTGDKEYIIQDSVRYSLVIFSASWCAPCHEQIPLLKEIHKDLGERLEMVYISIDDTTTVERWKVLMEKEKIPWRSLLTSNSRNLASEYHALVIPCAYLVYPDMQYESLDIRDEENRQKLYQLIREQ